MFPLLGWLLARAYPAGQHTQGPLVQVHDGVVLPLVAIDLLRAEQGQLSWRTSCGWHFSLPAVPYGQKLEKEPGRIVLEPRGDPSSPTQGLFGLQ